jgi:hypothetical protein
MTTWTKKSAKGWQEWDKLVAMVAYFPTSWKCPWKQGLLVKSCFSKRLWNLWMTSIFFITIQAFNCNPRYHVGRHGQWPKLWMKHLFKPMMKQCALNQIQGFWLLLDALEATLTTNVKCKLMLIIYQ